MEIVGEFQCSMLESRQEMLYDDPSKTFSGVHFVLLGFDLSTEEKIRSKLVNGGGTDAGRYGPDCTHVIVCEILYDDPICVAARKEGKILVTGLWVEHSSDIGMPVDPASIMYRPLRDLNGIPGAKSLIVCLTGYQRQDREDIMTMVGLMGANFSKPLIANKVTHLICYKFEGDKYELAKKMKKIKLVNHRWLEDCLRAWKLLPEADYDKSGHELEMMEAQAKDSEDETEDVAKRQHGERGIVATPKNTRCEVRSPCQPLVLRQGVSGQILDVDTSGGMSDVGKTIETELAREEKTPNCFQLKEIPDACFEISGSVATRAKGEIYCGTSLNSLAKSPVSENVGSDFASACKTERNSSPSSASKFHSISYSRKTTSLDIGHVRSNAGSIPRVDIGKLHVDDGLNTSSSTVEHERTIFNCVRTPTPSKEISSHPEDAKIGNLPEKRKMDVSTGSSKLQKTCNDSELVLEGASVANESEVPRPTSSTCKPHDITNHHSPRKHFLGVSADLDPSPGNISGTMMPRIAKECSEKASQTLSEKLKSAKECSEKAPQTSSEKLKSPSLGNKSPPETTDVHSDRPENAVADGTGPQSVPQNLNIPCLGAERVEIQKSDVTLEIPLEGDANSTAKPLKRKLLANKTLGSRPSFGRGKPLNQKGSIHVNKKGSPRNSKTRSTGGKEIEDIHKFVDSEKLMAPPNSNVDQVKNVETESLSESGDQASNKTGLVYDEIAATEYKEKGLPATACKGVSCGIHTPKAVSTSRPSDGNVVDSKDQAVIFGRSETSTAAENVASDKGRELSELDLENNTGGEKTTIAKKRPLLKSKKENILPVTVISKSKKGEPRKEAKCKAKCDKAEGKNEKGSFADRHLKLRPEDAGKDSAEVEKENRPVLTVDHNLSHNKQQIGKLIAQPGKKSTKTDDGNPGSISAAQIPKVKTGPVWFILSGHRLQRKEFQQVIRRLKGRVCRDTHQWSYQATHLIVPDPIRRTEKFFAAAASGRWILKTDYLAACNESGKFLAEEPYEWHKSGLSEDGAINLEAPRKWRLLRERTGHGAFYGMRIIIYGDCIVPPLDTLKRVVKAGDGTILATSPPYTRFLPSGVDFAIVSPGMPRVDIWVQEFLRHEIPCVLADYLVGYVCKPGYSLDRHVQYNTHAWAEKSFGKLVNSMNEIAEDLTSQEDDGNADVACEVCSSRDRGEVMLICGDEGGSAGCGIGTHIDCCDPPLQEIPEEDWLCSKCSSENTRKKPNKKKK